jgi:hypothetical protein
LWASPRGLVLEVRNLSTQWARDTSRVQLDNTMYGLPMRNASRSTNVLVLRKYLFPLHVPVSHLCWSNLYIPVKDSFHSTASQTSAAVSRSRGLRQ